jgi:hypothetical protein
MVFGETEWMGHQMPSGGTARGDECTCCGRRWSKMVYLNGGQRWCMPCNAENHKAAAKEGCV